MAPRKLLVGLVLTLATLGTSAVGVAGGIGAAPSGGASGTVYTSVAGPMFDAVKFTDGRVEYRYHRSLLDTATHAAALLDYDPRYSVTEVLGERVWRDGEAGCEFSGSMDSAQAPKLDGVIYVEREIGFSFDKCSQTLEGAWLPVGVATDAGLLDEDASSTSESLDGPAAATSYEYQGFMRGHTTDPVGIYVAKTYSNEQWSWSGSCATAWNRWSSWTPFILSGWSTYSSSYYFMGSCDRGLHTYGLYRNGTFCLSIDAWTEHTVEFKATGDPASWASWALYKWGGCSWLLSTGHWYDPY
ncbi:MAG: hypothetical protein ABIJ48_08630 [Actinomycetota bacterium]